MMLGESRPREATQHAYYLLISSELRSRPSRSADYTMSDIQMSFAASSMRAGRLKAGDKSRGAVCVYIEGRFYVCQKFGNN